ncbi:hypothetical protein LCGC14_3030040, partial [marine sediment metagenome]
DVKVTILPLSNRRSNGAPLHPDDQGKYSRDLASGRYRVLAEAEGYTYISPYNDAEVIAGQGTAALELLDQIDGVDNVFISMGGGGLISGMGSVIKEFSPQTRVIGVSATNSCALAASIKAGKIVDRLDVILP